MSLTALESSSDRPLTSQSHKGSAIEPEHEFLTFTLGSEEYGIDILKVQEIRGYNAVTPIISAPAFIKGVMNLRGTIVPIVDLRIKFGVGSAQYDAFTVVVVLKILSRTIGIVVDSVSDVLQLTSEQIRPAPQFGQAMDTEYLLGLGALEGRMLILVDIERLISSRDMALFDGDDGTVAKASAEAGDQHALA
ncbi:MAG: chemotaxis protein CheW [Burkholderiaceae bacterium]